MQGFCLKVSYLVGCIYSLCRWSVKAYLVINRVRLDDCTFLIFFFLSANEYVGCFSLSLSPSSQRWSSCRHGISCPSLPPYKWLKTLISVRWYGHSGKGFEKRGRRWKRRQGAGRAESEREWERGGWRVRREGKTDWDEGGRGGKRMGGRKQEGGEIGVVEQRREKGRWMN